MNSVIFHEQPKPRPVTRQRSPHLRCGICDELFGANEDTIYFDDERCHRSCVTVFDGPVRPLDVAHFWLTEAWSIGCCSHCATKLRDEDSHCERCPSCGEELA